MNEIQPRIIEDEEGRSFLVIGEQEYELGNRGEVNLDGRVLPTIRVDQVPQGVSFILNYKFMLISVPIFFTDSGNLGIALWEELGDPFDGNGSSPFMDFWMELPRFIEESVEQHTGAHFAVMNMDGETLEAVFGDVKKSIDEFWLRYQPIFDELKAQGYDAMEVKKSLLPDQQIRSRYKKPTYQGGCNEK